MFLTLYSNNRFRFWANRAGNAMRYIGNQTCRSIDALAYGVGASVGSVVCAELLTQLLLSLKYLDTDKQSRQDYPVIFLNCLLVVTAHRFKENKHLYSTHDFVESSNNRLPSSRI